MGRAIKVNENLIDSKFISYSLSSTLVTCAATLLEQAVHDVDYDPTWPLKRYTSKYNRNALVADVISPNELAYFINCLGQIVSVRIGQHDSPTVQPIFSLPSVSSTSDMSLAVAAPFHASTQYRRLLVCNGTATVSLLQWDPTANTAVPLASAAVSLSAHQEALTILSAKHYSENVIHCIVKFIEQRDSSPSGGASAASMARTTNFGVAVVVFASSPSEQGPVWNLSHHTPPRYITHDIIDAAMVDVDTASPPVGNLGIFLVSNGSLVPQSNTALEPSKAGQDSAITPVSSVATNVGVVLGEEEEEEAFESEDQSSEGGTFTEMLSLYYLPYEVKASESDSARADSSVDWCEQIVSCRLQDFSLVGVGGLLVNEIQRWHGLRQLALKSHVDAIVVHGSGVPKMHSMEEHSGGKDSVNTNAVENPFQLRHIFTLNAFGFIIQGKRNRRFITFSADGEYAAIAEASRYVYVYKTRPPSSTPHKSVHQVVEITSREPPTTAGDSKKPSISNSDDILGMQALPGKLIVLGRNKVVVCYVGV